MYSTYKNDIKDTVKLALPVIADNITSMGAGVVAVLLAGKINKENLGALGIGYSLLFFIIVFGFSTVTALVPIVAQGFGANDKLEIETNTANSFWVAFVLAIFGFFFLFFIKDILILTGQKIIIADLAIKYVYAGCFGIIFGFFYSVVRSFILGIGKPKITMLISLLGFIINVACAFILVNGKFGFNTYGIAGCGYAYSLATFFELIFGLIIINKDPDLKVYNFAHYILKPNPKIIKNIFKLGLPIAITSCLEFGVFNFVNILMGRIGTVPLASHQIAINLASLTFMVPFGISIATSTRVGHAIGRNDMHGARLAGWLGISIGFVFMFITASTFFFFSKELVSLYTQDNAVLKYATNLLLIAGLFQIFDGVQVTAVGAARGYKDTKRQMFTNLVSYWLIGLPLGYLLVINFKFGGFGYWIGLTIGLFFASILHTLRFKKISTVTESNLLSEI